MIVLHIFLITATLLASTAILTVLIDLLFKKKKKISPLQRGVDSHVRKISYYSDSGDEWKYAPKKGLTLSERNRRLFGINDHNMN